jgi:GT2 family glycosyltransferase
MKVHVVTPFDLGKNLGSAFNEEFSRCPEGDWLCTTDIDVLLLTSDTINILTKYAELYPDAMFLCRSNRSGSKRQRLMNRISSDDRIKKWISIALSYQRGNYTVAPVKDSAISGFLMLISKKMWDTVKFNEDLKCLGVDRDFVSRVLEAGHKVYVMDEVVVWHTYRLSQGRKDRSHLI